MAIYDAGTASLAADGAVTGVGTTWRQPLTLIRVGATMIFNTTPASIVTIAEILSDTEIRVFNDKGFTAPAGTQYSILAHDGITVQGLAQDVAETLRHYQSRETEVAAAVDAFNQFDADAFQTNVNQVNTQSQQVATDAARVASDKVTVSADKDSAAASAASALADKNAAAASAAEAADSAASLDTSNLLRVDGSLSDLTDKPLSRSNLDVYSKGEILSLLEPWDISNFGYVYGSSDDAKDSILSAISKFGRVHLSGDITVSSFGWPAGAKITGRSNITYTRRPSIPCVLSDETLSVSWPKMKGVYVFGDFTLFDLLQIKTCGFNTIIHYQYGFYDNGNIGQVVNACNAIGMDLVINSPNDAPDQGLVDLINSNDRVLGVYVFDEPQHSNQSRAAQDLRISAWRAKTGKQIWTTDNGIFGIGNDTFSPNYDVVLVDQYHIGSETDEDNKAFAILGWNELSYKSGNAKMMPTVGLFLSDSQTNLEKQISQSRQFFKIGGGSYFAFAWDSSSSDQNQVDIVSNERFYAEAKRLNQIKENRPYKIDVCQFGPGVGLSGLINKYNKDYSSSDVEPFAVINTGSAIDERMQAFSDLGIVMRNNGGLAALNMESLGFVCSTMSFRNHADGSSGITIDVNESPNDYYTQSTVISKTLSSESGFTAGANFTRGNSIGFMLTPELSEQFRLKYVSGVVITTDWIDSI